LVFNHRQSLADQLRQVTDAAVALHVATVLLVQVHTQFMVHVPGRCIPQLIGFLSQYVPSDQHAVLVECQGALFRFVLTWKCEARGSRVVLCL
jgi:hypothetical protein